MTANQQAIILTQFSDHNFQVGDVSSISGSFQSKVHYCSQQTENKTKWIDERDKNTGRRTDPQTADFIYYVKGNFPLMSTY